ncbi:MAG: DUF5011 domain-containing protein [Lachnospiraceae bacterium]|nr:DUF5011 domain-containing protein [Lachnospiraceae bacterium]
MDIESYGNGVELLVSIPQCETCENYIKGDLLHCRCYDWELKLRVTEDETEPEDQIPQCETCENYITGDLSHCKCYDWELRLSETEDKIETEDKKIVKNRNVVTAYFLDSRMWMWHYAIVAVLIGCVAYWFYCQPRFHDLTVELGTETISVESFMTEFADARNAGIVTDLSTVDISVTGSIPLTLRSGRKDEMVTLTIEDTTPPEAEFISWMQKPPDYTPDPYDFVVSYYDLSDVKVYFAENVAVSPDYEDQSFTVVVEDASGNAVSQVCTLSIVWMKSEYTMELGESLSKEDLLYDSDRDGYRIDQSDIDVINESGVGEYMVASLVDENVCKVRVADTTPPELSVTDISVFKGKKVTVDDFVETCSDISGDVEVSLVTEPDVDTPGVQTMTIKATDINGNTATATATLAVVRDKKPPVIKGLTTLSVAKHSVPDYLAGVSAIDVADGACEVTYDAGRVDLTVAGTYFVTYTSKDKDGNIATSKRTVVVGHDQEDTDALAASIAAGLSSDPEAIRDYVRNTIRYSHNSGGDDPVWYGFTNKSGDCLVHALCLQSLLSKKGYETRLIWVTNRSHYWLIIHLNGVWRHIDATPGNWHTRYSLMTDEQRYSILQGRDWDRSAWPACE